MFLFQVSFLLLLLFKARFKNSGEKADHSVSLTAQTSVNQGSCYMEVVSWHPPFSSNIVFFSFLLPSLQQFQVPTDKVSSCEAVVGILWLVWRETWSDHGITLELELSPGLAGTVSDLLLWFGNLWSVSSVNNDLMMMMLMNLFIFPPTRKCLFSFSVSVSGAQSLNSLLISLILLALRSFLFVFFCFGSLRL